jgi:hypothetical protein
MEYSCHSPLGAGEEGVEKVQRILQLTQKPVLTKSKRGKRQGDEANENHYC